ncbi:uncharacterized protein HaLaN_10304 [Haematococcus lacustris]|uniref:ferroxidase n=1 Tax=Haematococcus lacustris TaxID=44745 RepID=A0A699Z5C7_HAELA|nr:uncharacterized protein HaLaN_10304 [Haematococcus lacustris]
MMEGHEAGSCCMLWHSHWSKHDGEDAGVDAGTHQGQGDALRGLAEHGCTAEPIVLAPPRRQMSCEHDWPVSMVASTCDWAGPGNPSLGLHLSGGCTGQCCHAGHASEQDFHKLADTTLDELHEAYVEGLNLDDSDVEYSQGVLSVKLGKAGTYVLNKQAPNRQIWLSSPVSGPLRFDWDSQRQQWVYHRDGRELLSLLDAELTKLCGQSPRLTPA